MLALTSLLLILVPSVTSLWCDKSINGEWIDIVNGQEVQTSNVHIKAAGDSCPSELDRCAWIPTTQVGEYKKLDAYTKDSLYHSLIEASTRVSGLACASQADCKTIKAPAGTKSCYGAKSVCCCEGDMCNSKGASSFFSFIPLLVAAVVASLSSRF